MKRADYTHPRDSAKFESAHCTTPPAGKAMSHIAYRSCSLSPDVLRHLPRGIFATGLALAFLWPALRLHAADRPVGETFDAKGVKIRYLVEGQGEPVVLIHGLHASADINWRLPGVMSTLARDHQVIALDLPGHGGSDKPHEPEAYGKQMSEDVLLLLDHLKIKKTHIVGYSLGGMVAMRFIVDHPDRVISATIGGMGWLREGGKLQKFWERIPVREGDRTPPECIHEIGKLALTREELEGIKVPAIVIVGDRDPVRRLYVEPLEPIRKDWQIVEIERAGHINCIFKQQFAQAIVDWVRKWTEKPK